jgi:ABC-type lipopolysaccharide export system ATPase subunit
MNNVKFFAKLCSSIFMGNSSNSENEYSQNGNHTIDSVNSLFAQHLQKTYGRRKVVDDVSLIVRKGEVVGLLGANGAGKTTTFYMMTGLERAEKGKILLNRQDVTKLPMYLRARLGLGYLPQEPSIFRKMSAEQNILAVLETMKFSRADRFARLEELLELHMSGESVATRFLAGNDDGLK